MRDPGVIWYWVNEDDCDEDRKPGKKGMKDGNIKRDIFLKSCNHFG